jgi:WD40 repeat protein
MIAARQQLEGDGPFLLGSPIPVGDALSLALSPNGAFLAAGQRDGTIIIIDTETRMPVGAPLTGHKGGVEDLDFSADGTQLVSSGDDGTIWLWPVEDGFVGAGNVVARFDDVVWAVTFDPAGKKIASAGEDGSVRLWDADTAAQIGEPLAWRTGDFLSVAFSPDGSGLMVGNGEGEIWGWNLPSGERIMRPILGAHSSDIWELVFSPSGDRVATASSDGTSVIVSYPEGRVIGHAFAPEDGIQCVEALPDGSGLVGGGTDGRVRLWSFEDATTKAISAIGHNRPITEIALSADGHLLATLGGDQAARLWTLSRPIASAVDRTVEGATAKGVALGDGGRVVAAGDDTGLIQLWRDDDRVPVKFVGHERPVWALAISPDGKTLASADRSGEVIVWNAVGGTIRDRIEGYGGATWWVGFAAGGELLATANDSGVEIWNVETMIRAAELPQKSGQVTRAAVSPDGRQLATASSDGHVRLFDLADNRLVREFAVIDDVVWSVAFSPDGKLLASAGSDEVVSLWDIATGERRASLAGHSGGAMEVAFRAVGVTLAVVDRSGQLHLWDVLSERRLAAPIPAHAGASWRLAVEPHGNIFATAGDDGKVRTWDVLSAERACEIGTPAFDSARRHEYFGEASHPLSCATILQ